jgi:hypothetical protein
MRKEAVVEGFSKQEGAERLSLLEEPEIFFFLGHFSLLPLPPLSAPLPGRTCSALFSRSVKE